MRGSQELQNPAASGTDSSDSSGAPATPAETELPRMDVAPVPTGSVVLEPPAVAVASPPPAAQPAQQAPSSNGLSFFRRLASDTREYFWKVVGAAGITGIFAAVGAVAYRVRFPGTSQSIEDTHVEIVPPSFRVGFFGSTMRVAESITNLYIPTESRTGNPYTFQGPDLSRVGRAEYIGITSAMGSAGTVLFMIGSAKGEQVRDERREALAGAIKAQLLDGQDGREPTSNVRIQFYDKFGKVLSHGATACLALGSAIVAFKFGTPVNNPIDGAQLRQPPLSVTSFDFNTNTSGVAEALQRVYCYPFTGYSSTTVSYEMNLQVSIDIYGGNGRIEKFLNEDAMYAAGSLVASSYALSILGNRLQDKAYLEKFRNGQMEIMGRAAGVEAMRRADHLLGPAQPARAFMDPDVLRALISSPPFAGASHAGPIVFPERGSREWDRLAEALMARVQEQARGSSLESKEEKQPTRAGDAQMTGVVVVLSTGGTEAMPERSGAVAAAADSGSRPIQAGQVQQSVVAGLAETPGQAAASASGGYCALM